MRTTEKPRYCEGYLKKWTNYVKQYQRRWFVYENGYLTYYRDRSEVGQLTRAQIHLLGCNLKLSPYFGFTINKNQELLFSLRAENREDYDKWLTAIGHGIIQCNQAVNKGSEMSVKSHGDILNTPLSQCLSDFTETIAYVRENCRQLKLSADFVEKSVINVINRASIANPADANLTVCEDLSSFRDLGDKMLNSLEELLTRAQLLSDCAANYQALQNFNYPRSMSETLSNVISQSHPNGADHNSQEGTSDADSFFDVLPEQPTTSPTGNFLRANSTGDDSDRPVGRAKSVSELHAVGHAPSMQYRQTIPDRPAVKLNLWSILSGMEARDLSRMALPVNFNEPLSMLQRIAESLEYSKLLDKAAVCEDPLLQINYVVSFVISNYYTTAFRINKPFNPLLGETYECDRRADMGWRCICEQVSHHPPVCAMHADGEGWVLWETYDVKSRFTPTASIEIKPKGLSQLAFTRTGYRYSWNKVTTHVQNLIVGKLRIEQSGTMTVTNHSTGHTAVIDFLTEGWLSSKDARKIEGYVMDADKKRRYALSGYWNNYVESHKLLVDSSGKQTTIDSSILWQGISPPKESEKRYNFSPFACSLNQPEPNIPPTDSRNRPDQRAMEEGNFDEANTLKSKLEDNQRSRRNRVIQEAVEQGKATPQTSIEELREPLWFRVDPSVPHDACQIYTYKGGYWEAKSKNDFSMCPNIFDLSNN